MHVSVLATFDKWRLEGAALEAGYKGGGGHRGGGIKMPQLVGDKAWCPLPASQPLPCIPFLAAAKVARQTPLLFDFLQQQRVQCGCAVGDGDGGVGNTQTLALVCSDGGASPRAMTHSKAGRDSCCQRTWGTCASAGAQRRRARRPAAAAQPTKCASAGLPDTLSVLPLPTPGGSANPRTAMTEPLSRVSHTSGTYKVVCNMRSMHYAHLVGPSVEPLAGVRRLLGGQRVGRQRRRLGD